MSFRPTHTRTHYFLIPGYKYKKKKKNCLASLFFLCRDFFFNCGFLLFDGYVPFFCGEGVEGERVGERAQKARKGPSREPDNREGYAAKRETRQNDHPGCAMISSGLASDGRLDILRACLLVFWKSTFLSTIRAGRQYAPFPPLTTLALSAASSRWNIDIDISIFLSTIRAGLESSRVFIGDNEKGSHTYTHLTRYLSYAR
jgi:hypothetical protein